MAFIDSMPGFTLLMAGYNCNLMRRQPEAYRSDAIDVSIGSLRAPICLNTHLYEASYSAIIESTVLAGHASAGFESEAPSPQLSVSYWRLTSMTTLYSHRLLHNYRRCRLLC